MYMYIYIDCTVYYEKFVAIFSKLILVNFCRRKLDFLVNTYMTERNISVCFFGLLDRNIKSKKRE